MCWCVWVCVWCLFFCMYYVCVCVCVRVCWWLRPWLYGPGWPGVVYTGWPTQSRISGQFFIKFKNRLYVPGQPGPCNRSTRVKWRHCIEAIALYVANGICLFAHCSSITAQNVHIIGQPGYPVVANQGTYNRTGLANPGTPPRDCLDHIIRA